LAAILLSSDNGTDDNNNGGNLGKGKQPTGAEVDAKGRGGMIFKALCDKKKIEGLFCSFCVTFPHECNPIFLTRQLHERVPLIRLSFLPSH
jgi:hypothetical protein